MVEEFSEAKLASWRGLKDSHAKASKITRILVVVTALGWLLFLYKIGQTSEMALRYSSQAQESIGTWVMILLLLTVGSIFGGIVSGKMKRQSAQLAAELISSLRNLLSAASDSDRSRIESQLRELGA